jgi:hypothetical protein
MSPILFLAILVALAVAAVLVIGLVSMIKGGEWNKKYGNKLMMARVGLQAVAVVLLMALWMAST